MKVCAYAICKDEESRIEQWLEATKDCDSRVVVDTGSSDRSVSILRDAGVMVVEKHWETFRFDEPRNLALSLTPADTDWFISPDFDEQFAPGWREELEEIDRAAPGTTLVEYQVWLRKPDGSSEPGQEFGRKMHRRCYRWVQPVHEYLVHDGSGPESIHRSRKIAQIHAQDPSRDRERFYMDLAIEHLAADPGNEWLAWFVFRGYAFIRRDLQKCIEMGTRYLDLTRPYSSFRAIALTEVARAQVERSSDPATGISLLLRAVSEDPANREAWEGLGSLAARSGDWALAAFAYSKLLPQSGPEGLHKTRLCARNLSKSLNVP